MGATKKTFKEKFKPIIITCKICGKECETSGFNQKTCKECQLINRKLNIQNWYVAHYTHKRGREYHKKSWRKIKRAIYDLLGNRCANPFNIEHGDFLTELRCLQIDHVHGDGRAQRLGKNPYKYLKQILDELTYGSTDYQLLCANCNWIKAIEHKKLLRNRKDRVDEN